MDAQIIATERYASITDWFFAGFGFTAGMREIVEADFPQYAPLLDGLPLPDGVELKPLSPALGPGTVIKGDRETAIALSPADAKKLDADAIFARAVIESDVPATRDLTMRETCKKCGAEGLSWVQSYATRRPYLAGLYVIGYDGRRTSARYEIRAHFLICKGSK